jgi:shikimate kinase
VRPIVLIGFMGTGKTTVGRQLAARTGRRFLDLDDVISQRAGRPVPEIFRSDGEPAFRRLEREALEHVLAEEGVVIATGGGAACREPNLSLMLERADVVALWASPEEVIRRTGARSGRPLLDGAQDPLAAAQALLAAREPFYRRAHLRVETEGKRPELIAQEIAERIADQGEGGITRAPGKETEQS